MNSKSNDEIKSLLATARTRIAELQVEARSLVDDYRQFHKEQNRLRTNSESQSGLYPRIKVRNIGFAIEWSFIEGGYLYPEGPRRKFSTAVARHRGYRAALKRYSRDWEWQRLEAFEDRAEMILREVGCLTNLIKGYGHLARLQASKKAA